MDKSKIEQNKTPASIYLMHKYWGKKPSKDLKDIILIDNSMYLGNNI